MNWEYVFWALVLALLVYELITLHCTKAPDDHITAIFRRLNENPLVPFAFGFMCGHLFW